MMKHLCLSACLALLATQSNADIICKEDKRAVDGPLIEVKLLATAIGYDLTSTTSIIDMITGKEHTTQRILAEGMSCTISDLDATCSNYEYDVVDIESSSGKTTINVANLLGDYYTFKFDSHNCQNLD